MYFSGFVFFLGACSGPVKIDGSVKDIWGKPIKGAMVQLEGGDENQITNAQGLFSFNAKKGEMVFRAGGEGHIHDKIIISYDPASKDPKPKVEFSLYPEPGGEGFFAVGAEEYIALNGEPIVEKATQLTTMQGILKVGQARLPKTSQEFVFQTDLRREEILQISPFSQGDPKWRRGSEELSTLPLNRLVGLNVGVPRCARRGPFIFYS